MTHYLSEITRIKDICYRNQRQLDTVIGTRNYINKHFDEELSLELLSEVNCTSKFHLLRLFKRYYGLTPKQYHIESRLYRAKALLLEGANIAETCYDVGFESPSSFSTLFKTRFFGSTPSDFRKRATFAKSDSF
ncbi:helix-turn-helix domain-containing protein [Flavobacterium sp. ST-75]|uniref:Helix-turn-helix domain-containing protein n=1 Tax=Flavobacterium rhizophilum TaxID=3163296 RepID=A0ABW8Y902_9FLAO